MRRRQIAPVAVVLVLTVAGFVAARLLAERDARRDSDRRADVAAAQIRGRVTQAASLTASLRRFMLDNSGIGVTSDQFARNALRWLSPAGFPAAAWVERVPASRRGSYERRIGQPIVTPGPARAVVPRGSRSFYLPATLVSGFPPISVPGSDLSGDPGIAATLDRARIDGVAASPLAPPRTGTNGLVLVAPATNLIDGALRPGYVVVFVSKKTLRAATDEPAVRIISGGTSTKAPAGAGKRFTAAGLRFDAIVPIEAVHGPGAVLPWLILAAGVVLAGLAAALGANAARRAEAQADLDRVFTLSHDLIAVANFDGYFTRVNPAAEEILGYTEQELLERPYGDFVHPDDRERTTTQAAALGRGETMPAFENRYVRKDGIQRVLEWKTTPVPEAGVMYGVARDVTERRRAETEVERLAGEQAALRRVATLVAREAPQAEVFTAIAEEIGHLLATEEIQMLRYEADTSAVVVARWGRFEHVSPIGTRLPLDGESASARVFRTGQPARVDYGSSTGASAERARAAGIRCVVGAPIIVDGRRWGAMVTGTNQEEPLPPETESRLARFTELMGTAIANAESHAKADRLTEEQGALRRVATLIAGEPSQAELFAKVTEELAKFLGDVDSALVRYEHDGTATVVAVWGPTVSANVRAGARWPVDGDGVVATVLREGRPYRIDDYSAVPDVLPEGGPAPPGIRSAVGCPIIVGGRIWGALTAAGFEAEAFPPETETQIAQFAELVTTGIANAETRAEVERLADEQAALRRVATLVAQGVKPRDLFGAVAQEVAALLGTGLAGMIRYDSDGTASPVATWAASGQSEVASQLALLTAAGQLARTIADTGRPARIDDYDRVTGAVAISIRDEFGISSSVGSPIVVEGRLWGALFVHATDAGRLDVDTETRLQHFAELVATAIANSEARTEVERLADEQAALRRVATLVAEAASPTAVFDAVAAEMAALLGADHLVVCRYEPNAELTVLARRTQEVPSGVRISHEGDSVEAVVRRTERSARMDTYEGARGAIAEAARAAGVRVGVGAPIVVDRRLWGVVAAGWGWEEPPPAETEQRMAQFAELLATAIANADSRDQLTASRARLMTAGDEARRRLVRDLHDGAQQRLVHAIVTLRLAEQALVDGDADALSLVSEALANAQEGNKELRELAHGILPSALAHGGLRAGVEAVVARLDLPVDVDLPESPLPREIEASAYFVIAEALTNVVKHAHAESAAVKGSIEDGLLRVEVRDDGIGGADRNGHGLVGLADRAVALGGRIELQSPEGGGTVLTAFLPVPAPWRGAPRSGRAARVAKADQP
jgi:PAS domain S-box-containing protein